MNLPVSRIDGFEGVPTTMTLLDYQNVNSHKEVLIAGDDLGWLNFIEVENDWHICNDKMNCHGTEIKKKKENEIAKQEELFKHEMK